jgi:hypothetical protein
MDLLYTEENPNPAYPESNRAWNHKFQMTNPKAQINPNIQ